MFQITVRLDAISLGRFNQTVQIGAGLSARYRIRKQMEVRNLSNQYITFRAFLPDYDAHSHSISAANYVPTMRYYQSTDATITTGDSMLVTDVVASLVAGASSPESSIVTAPSVSGTYWVGACVDIVAGETSTSNQCTSGARLTVGALSDDDDILLMVLPAIIYSIR